MVFFTKANNKFSFLQFILYLRMEMVKSVITEDTTQRIEAG